MCVCSGPRTRTNLCLFACVSVHMCVHSVPRTRTICVCLHVFVWVGGCIFVCIYVCMSVCMCVHMCVCECV